MNYHQYEDMLLETRVYPKCASVVLVNDKYRLYQWSWTEFVPEAPGRDYHQTGNFDYHQRSIEKSVKLFGKHLFWFSIRKEKFCFNADNASYITGCCFGHSFDEDIEKAFAKLKLSKEQFIEKYSDEK